MKAERMLEAIFGNESVNAYGRTWRKASGHEDAEPPGPHRGAYWVDRSGFVKWVYTHKDCDGLWWSVRIDCGLIASYSNWESHKQRQGARNRAAARCKVEQKNNE